MPTKRKAAPRCGVADCTSAPVVEVLLYDVYQYGDGRVYDVVMDQDFTCPYLCMTHLKENEEGCWKYKPVDYSNLPHTDAGSGFILVNLGDLPEPTEEDRVRAGKNRKYRGSYHYPHTNRHGAQGFSIYRPLEGTSL